MDRLAGGAVVARRDVADRASVPEGLTLVGGEVQGVDDGRRGPVRRDADADDREVGAASRVERVGDRGLGEQRVAGDAGLEGGRRVEEAVAGAEADRQLPDQLLAADLVADGREAPDQLDEVEAGVLEVRRRGVDHRLQGVAPRQRHGHRVLDVVHEQPRRLGADQVVRAGPRSGREGDTHVPQPEDALDLLLEPVHAAARVVDPDLDDPLPLRLAEHPRHVGAAGAQLLRDVRLRAALHVVEARSRQQRGGVAGQRHRISFSHVCADVVHIREHV